MDSEVFKPNPAWGNVETRLRQAIWNIERGTPTAPELQAAALAGRLRVSVTTVAKEAGVSRTLIGHDECPYPDVRSDVLKHKVSKVAELERRVLELQGEVKELRRLLAARDSAHAELTLRARQALLQRKPLESDASKSQREAAVKLVGQTNQSAGKVFD